MAAGLCQYNGTREHTFRDSVFLREAISMTTSPVRHERRAAQRFEYQIPVSLKIGGQEREERGCTQNLSARGAFFYTDCPIAEGATIEITVLMPAEITLAESMRVRCRGRVLRVLHAEGDIRIGVAAQLEGYEYLAEAATAAAEGSFARISSLHEQAELSDRNAVSPLRGNR